MKRFETKTKTFSLTALLIFLTAGCAPQGEDLDPRLPLPYPSRVKNFRKTWEFRAMQLQQRLTRKLPLNYTTMLGAHNSFENWQDTSTDNFDRTRHAYDILGQLGFGLRWITLDVDYYSGPLAKHGPRVHHNPNGAMPFQMTLQPILQKIKNFIRNKENSSEIVVIDLEQRWGEKIPLSQKLHIAQVIWDIFDKGKDIYTPRDWFHDYGQGQERSWPTFPTPEKMIARKKRVIFVTSFKQAAEELRAPQTGQTILFEKHDKSFTGQIPWGSPSPDINYLYSPGVKSFRKNISEYPHCIYPGQDSSTVDDFHIIPGLTALSGDTQTDYWTNIGYEGSFGLFAEKSQFGKFQTQDVVRALSCGANVLDLDPFRDSGRSVESLLAASIWSWRRDHPHAHDQRKNCASLDSSTRWKNISCFENLAFACYKRDSFDTFSPQTGAICTVNSPLYNKKLCQMNITGVWKVTQAKGKYSNGDKVCRNEFGQDWVFAVPVNGRQNLALVDEMKKDHQVKEIYLNTNDIIYEGYWQSSGVNLKGQSPAL